MGKHKDKKQHKKSSKKKSHKKKESCSSDSSSNNSEDDWVEKEPEIMPEIDTTIEAIPFVRDEWMSLSSAFSSISHLQRRQVRENEKRLEKERNQYNPREHVRELNPYWKDGGEGLPSFKKPAEEDDLPPVEATKSKSSNWRKRSDTPPICDFNFHSEEPTASEEPEVLTEGELNKLAAKLVKAEIMGNADLVAELKNKLEDAKKVRENSKPVEQDVLLTLTDSRGYSRPLKMQSDYGESSGNRRKKQKVETHADGQRVRYFADDDKYSLKQMFEQEKFSSVEQQNAEFLQLAGNIRKNDDLDDVFTDNIRKKTSDEKVDKQNRDKAVFEHSQLTQSLENCNRCLQSDSMLKHLMVGMGETIYLGLPNHEPLTDGHCLLIPTRHISCATQLDENEWSELLDFRKALIKMFGSDEKDVIFFETAMYFSRYPHMVIHCVPLPKEQGDMAPIYFKKAIDESETEWASNKKLVSLSGRDVRRAIPKGLPYFSVSFGMDEGFAHVIEDQRQFPNNFAQEVIGGMMDLHHSKWRKPKRQNFEEQKKRVLEFTESWNKFDCTKV